MKFWIKINVCPVCLKVVPKLFVKFLPRLRIFLHGLRFISLPRSVSEVRTRWRDCFAVQRFFPVYRLFIPFYRWYVTCYVAGYPIFRFKALLNGVYHFTSVCILSFLWMSVCLFFPVFLKKHTLFLLFSSLSHAFYYLICKGGVLSRSFIWFLLLLFGFSPFGLLFSSFLLFPPDFFFFSLILFFSGFCAFMSIEKIVKCVQ